MSRYDFVVLGSGPAGRRAAVQAAKLGKSVLVIDNRARVGGVSVHTGTIPSKTLRETALNLSGWRERRFYGAAHRVKSEICEADLATRLDMTLQHEIAVLEHQFARNGVRTLQGNARFLGTHTIAVDSVIGNAKVEEVIEAEKILIAVGTQPYRPSYIPFNSISVVDSDDLVRSPRVPRSLTVVGAGVIGLEYATIFSAMDVSVTIIEPRAELLEFMDRDVVENLIYQLRDRGVSIRLGAKVLTVEFGPSDVPICILADGRRVSSEMVLFTAGRLGATKSLEIQRCGLEADERGRLSVDPESFQTQQKHIYAAGDIIGFPSLASTSMEQGRTAACHAFGERLPASNQHFPLGIYSVPEVSAVGLTEQEIAKRGLTYECGIARLRETSRGHIMGVEAGILKLIFGAHDRRLLGVHIIGEGATELIHIGQAVINLGGTLDYFLDNSFNYPTLAEAYKVAALDAWNRLGAN